MGDFEFGEPQYPAVITKKNYKTDEEGAKFIELTVRNHRKYWLSEKCKEFSVIISEKENQYRVACNLELGDEIFVDRWREWGHPVKHNKFIRKLKLWFA